MWAGVWLFEFSWWDWAGVGVRWDWAGDVRPWLKGWAGVEVLVDGGRLDEGWEWTIGKYIERQVRLGGSSWIEEGIGWWGGRCHGASLETASQTIHDAVTTHQVMASQHFKTESAPTDSNADLEDSTYDDITTKT
ncbi:hypothetical protein Tco_0597308 [Tanacetum coccineum]